jgi:hypothetical protein
VKIAIALILFSSVSFAGLPSWVVYSQCVSPGCDGAKRTVINKDGKFDLGAKGWSCSVFQNDSLVDRSELKFSCVSKEGYIVGTAGACFIKKDKFEAVPSGFSLSEAGGKNVQVIMVTCE